MALYNGWHIVQILALAWKHPYLFVYLYVSFIFFKIHKPTVLSKIYAERKKIKIYYDFNMFKNIRGGNMV